MQASSQNQSDKSAADNKQVMNRLQQQFKEEKNSIE